MRIVILASENPVKIEAAGNGFQRLFPEETFEVRGVSVPSGVNDQPSSDAETLMGAHNRAVNAARAVPEADYWIGIEGGIQQTPEGMTAFAWVVVCDREREGRSRTGAFYLPARVAELVQQGLELGDADDLVFGKNNSKQKNGAIGILTDNVVDRCALYEQAVIMALVPFKNKELY